MLHAYGGMHLLVSKSYVSMG